MKGVIRPEGSPLPFCLFSLSDTCVFTITARTFVQSKGMVTVTFLGRKTASSTSCFRRQWPLARTPVVEGQRVTVRYWIDARAHIFERQMLLMFVCLLYNPRKLKTNKKTQHHPDSFFGIGMLFRNFALEPMRLPKFLCLAVLH